MVTDVRNGVLFVGEEGLYYHYFFLVKCLLQTRGHMGWRAPPHPARAQHDCAWTMLNGDAPWGGSSQRTALMHFGLTT